MSRERRTQRRRRASLRSLRRLKLKRRHLRTALAMTAPTAALLGFAGMQSPRAAEAVAMTATLPQGLPDPAEPPVPEAEAPAPPEIPHAKSVEASFYGDGFAGRRTANGEIFDPALMTAAHRTLPFDSLVRVTDARSGKSVVVRINDRGPFHGDRAIDLSEAAARKIGMAERGTARVDISRIAHA